VDGTAVLRAKDHAPWRCAVLGQSAQKAFVTVNKGDEIVQSFHHDGAQAAGMLDTLHQAPDMLYGCHAAMRGELTGGW
jgi:hypothetical protein